MDDLDFGTKDSGIVQVILLVALAVFMMAIGWGILHAPMDMKPILAYLLKAFILLVFGGIAAFCLVHALRSVRGQPGLPANLTARCLTCGERTPHDLVCPVCSEPPQNRAAAFAVSADEFWSTVLGSTILTGVGCLGLFIMIGPYLDGERRWWALIAFFALGLLMFVVGAMGFFGFLMAAWSRFKGAQDISFACKGPDRSTYGSGKIAWGKLVGLQGRGQITVPLVARGRSEGGYRVSPGDLSLAEAIATFDAAGLIELSDITTYAWQIGDPSGKTRVPAPEFNRTMERNVTMRFCTVADPHADVDEDVDSDLELQQERPRRAPSVSQESADAAIARFLARYLYLPLSLREFKTKLDADPVHRAQLEVHARVLRDRGIIVASPLVDAVVEGLLVDHNAAKQGSG